MRPLLRLAMLAITGLVSAGAAPPITFDQGWNDDQREAWHEAPQGSRLLPLAWLKALEQPETEALFLDPAYLAGFRFITLDGSPMPIGFAVDEQDDATWTPPGSHPHTNLRWFSGQQDKEKWVGLNCAACHTGMIAYGGHEMLIEGGSSLMDFQSFMRALNASLAKTLNDPAVADRFAKRVLPVDTPKNRAMLHAAVADATAWQAEQWRMSDTPLKYGFGRLDAFGHIFNRVTLDVHDPATPPPPAQPAEAPVRYPYIWNIHQLKRVQYNAFAPNTPLWRLKTFDPAALARNAAEVTGVFADVAAVADPGILTGYKSSIIMWNIVAMNQQLMRLRPPVWPADILPPLLPDKVFAGKAAFEKHCQTCHVLLDNLTDTLPNRISFFSNASAELERAAHAKDEPPDDMPANVAPGTDIWMACNADANTSPTGVMQGLPPGFLSFEGGMGSTALNRDMIQTIVKASMVGRKFEINDALLQTLYRGELPLRVPHTFEASGLVLGLLAPAPLSPHELQRGKCEGSADTLLGYKSRPLAGIWAAPPYLHNGSVPSLWELMLPAARRSPSFKTGTREYDPVHVGYETGDAPGNDFTLNTHDAAGTAAIDGNSNAGHDYDNASLMDDDRWNIIEYLKSLTIKPTVVH